MLCLKISLPSDLPPESESGLFVVSLPNDPLCTYEGTLDQEGDLSEVRHFYVSISSTGIPHIDFCSRDLADHRYAAFEGVPRKSSKPVAVEVMYMVPLIHR